MRKKFLLIIFVGLFPLLFCSCEDFVETGIEGQWQLQKIVDEDGVEHNVDTIYYAFKKNVFRYLKLTSDADGGVFTCFGNYERDGDKLSVSVVENTFNPWDSPDGFDWESLSREFVIKKHKNNDLELNLDGALYVLRRY